MQLEDFQIYEIAMNVGEDIWEMVKQWNYFAQDTIGKQLVRASDSIAANLSEGLGRYHFKETKHFSYYARGSLFETKTWLTKAYNRNLIEEDAFKKIIKKLDVLGIKINNYINSIGKRKS